MSRLEHSRANIAGVVMTRVGGELPEAYVYGGYGKNQS